MTFDPTLLFLSLVTSGVGFVLFVYGKKQQRGPQRAAGLVPMIYLLAPTHCDDADGRRGASSARRGSKAIRQMVRMAGAHCVPARQHKAFVSLRNISAPTSAGDAVEPVVEGIDVEDPAPCRASDDLVCRRGRRDVDVTGGADGRGEDFGHGPEPAATGNAAHWSWRRARHRRPLLSWEIDDAARGAATVFTACRACGPGDRGAR